MKISVHAVGRMKAGPEKQLADRYFERFAKSGPAVGLEFAGVQEIAEGRAQNAAERRREEGQKLQALLQQGAALFLLDERGKNLPSEDFAARIGAMRDTG
ncbi:MAG: 23S rRNA (pseudouridine(1915)-N(3))-methyltransferase RlmH, partial [Mesorhizobium sp.]|nr:23S rRNA (pseudouridine(1915)-N(3))-methyltransferase RlmH [Mesorhizobium sp.]